MKILEKLAAKQRDVFADSPATIVVFGDSNTQGCFECFMNEQGVIDTVFETENSYGAKLKHILQVLYPKAQINLINSGVSGDNATNALKRVESSVLAYKPDLVIVAFGTNDAGAGLDGLEQYKQSLQGIFAKLKENGCASMSEGLEKADWVLVDAYDVIVHIFRPEVREFYSLEKMWSAVKPR